MAPALPGSGWSRRFTLVFGDLPVEFDPTALIVLCYGAVVGVGVSPRWWGAPAGLLAALAVVLVHELGHALAARAFGLRGAVIRVAGLGGQARFEAPRDVATLAVVALAGSGVGAVGAALAGAWWSQR